MLTFSINSFIKEAIESVANVSKTNDSTTMHENAYIIMITMMNRNSSITNLLRSRVSEEHKLKNSHVSVLWPDV